MGAYSRVSLGMVALLIIAGCVSPSSVDHQRSQISSFELEVERQRRVTPPSLNGTITFPQVAAAILETHPSLAVLRLERQAQEGAAAQAGLWANPNLGAEYEGFAGSGELTGTDAAETTVSLSQEIPLAGKATKRRTLADLEVQASQWDQRVQALELLAEARRAFAAVVAAQRHLALAMENVALVERLTHGVAQRVDSGDVSPVEQTKAQVELSNAQIQQRRTEGALEAARGELASLWGAERPAFERAEPLSTLLPLLPPDDELRQRLWAHPRLQRFELEQQVAEAQLALARADAWPDLEVGGGVRQYNESNEHAFLLEVGVPLPFWNRNQGAIAEARARLALVSANRLAVERELTANLQRLTVGIRTQEAVVQQLRQDLLPKAKASHDAVNTAYQEGQKDLLDLLDAERTYLETLETLSEAESELGALHADLAGLLGTTLNDANLSLSEMP